MSLKPSIPQLLLTYDNAPCHVAKQQGALSTAVMNLSDGRKQLILTQTGWFNASTGTSMRIQQQMWFTGPDGSLIAKGALRICKERGLPGVANMRRDEMRALLASQPSEVLSYCCKRRVHYFLRSEVT